MAFGVAGQVCVPPGGQVSVSVLGFSVSRVIGLSGFRTRRKVFVGWVRIEANYLLIC